VLGKICGGDMQLQTVTHAALGRPNPRWASSQVGTVGLLRLVLYLNEARYAFEQGHLPPCHCVRAVVLRPAAVDAAGWSEPTVGTVPGLVPVPGGLSAAIPSPFQVVCLFGSSGTRTGMTPPGFRSV
jgi:hypothetical protein